MYESLLNISLITCIGFRIAKKQKMCCSFLFQYKIQTLYFLTPPVVCSADRSRAVVPVLVLLFVALWFVLRGDLLYVFPCLILFLCLVLVFLVLRLPRFGKEGIVLVLFVRLFDRFVLVWIGRFPLPLGVWEGLRFVIVALPGISLNFSFYRFYMTSLQVMLSDVKGSNKVSPYFIAVSLLVFFSSSLLVCTVTWRSCFL